MSLRFESPQVLLPQPETKAYFPANGESEILANEALRRAGDNLVYAIEYGSHVTGDASPTSRRDMILIVENAKRFHESNLAIAASDYGHPRNAGWHTYLNKFGFNFYHTSIQREGQAIPVKYASISREDFIKGCNGSLAEKEREGKGGFGLYIAGRMQKAALRPLFKDGAEKVAEIEQAINTARIDGVWLALGLQKQQFTLDDLTKSYVSLSYMADLRVEKPGKIQTMIDQSGDGYYAMLQPILNGFSQQGIVEVTQDGLLEKVTSLSKEQVETRLRNIKLRTIAVNYGKNPLTAGLGKGLTYALEKVKRARSASHETGKQTEVMGVNAVEHEIFPGNGDS